MEYTAPICQGNFFIYLLPLFISFLLFYPYYYEKRNLFYGIRYPHGKINAVYVKIFNIFRG